MLIAGGDDLLVYWQSAELYLPAPEVAAAGGDLGDQAVGVSSPAPGIVITNIGAQPLTVTGASLSGTTPSEFAITANAVTGRTLSFEQSCAPTVRVTRAQPG